MSILLGLCICVNPSNNKNPKKEINNTCKVKEFFEYNDI